MSISNFVGKKIVVDYRLLKDLSIDLVKQEGRKVLIVEGSIMESAKVFESVKIHTKTRTIFITVYSSLAFWNKKGSPDFKAVMELTLSPGSYDIQYIGTGKERILLKNINVKR